MITVGVTSGVPASFPDGRIGMIMSGATANFIMPDDLSNPNATVISALGLTSLTATPVTVSKNFFGINTNESSSGTPGANNPINDMRFGLYRSHDTVGLFWKDMETSAGVYNFTNLGVWLDTYHGRGKLIMMIYNTPAFYSARPGTGGPYSPTQGWQAEPSDMTKLTNYVTALCNYVNGRGQFIDYFEVWNEPNFTNASSGFRFYDGTVAKLSEMVRIVNQAAKAVFPTTKIICPATTNWDNSPAHAAPDVSATYFASMMAASDGAAGTMASWVDVVGYHSYGSPNLLINRITGIKAAATAAGLGALPIIDTEVGQNLQTSVASDTEYYLRICRSLVAQAASGITGSCIYAIGSLTPASGYSIENRPIFKIALTRLMRRIAKFGIDSASIAADGTVYATINGQLEKF